MRLLSISLASCLVGCFGPVFSDGITCESGICPPGLGCFDGVCLEERPGGDAAPSTDGRPSCQSFDAVHFDACALSEPGSAIDLDEDGTYVLDTDSGTLTDPNDNNVPVTTDVIDGMRIVSVDDFAVGPSSRLRPIGILPLVIASFQDIDIAGRIDVAEGGAGSDVDCGNLAPSRGNDNPTGGSGGGGAGFGTPGGDGGDSDFDGVVTQGGNGGQAVGVPTTVRGGCDGEEGGDGDPTSDGSGGDSGGALQLTARVAIVVNGVLAAGGDGGSGGEVNLGGGGGGGSGGYIGLEARRSISMGRSSSQTEAAAARAATSPKVTGAKMAARARTRPMVAGAARPLEAMAATVASSTKAARA